MYKLPILLFLKFFALSFLASSVTSADLPPIVDIYEIPRSSSEVEYLQSEVRELKKQLDEAYKTIRAQKLLVDPSHQKQQGPKNFLISLFRWNKRNAPLFSSQSLNASAEKEWEAAFQLLKAQQYKKAIEGFQKFIKQHPTHINQAGAYYFLAQLELLMGNTKKSLYYAKHFLKKYPNDTQAPKVQLYMGLAYYGQKDNVMAYKTLTQLIERYPDHWSAQEARLHLKKLDFKG